MIKVFPTLVLLAVLPTAAMAAAPDAKPAAQPLGGAAVPGLCLLSRDAVLANAAVGKAATARLKQLADQAQSQLLAERKPIDVDVKAFQADQARLSADQRQARQQDLTKRLGAIQSEAQLRNREIEATRVKVLQQIADQAQPVIASVYGARRCGLLVNRDTVLGGNLANDLTADVVKGLDAKLTTISFNLEQLPAQAPTAVQTASQ